MATMIRLRVRTRLRTKLLGFEPGNINLAAHQRWSMIVCFSLTQYPSCSHHQLSRNHTRFILEVAIRECRNTVKLSLTKTRCDKNKDSAESRWTKITAPFQPLNILNVLAPLHILTQKYFTDQAWNILYITWAQQIQTYFNSGADGFEDYKTTTDEGLPCSIVTTLYCNYTYIFKLLRQQNSMN